MLAIESVDWLDYIILFFIHTKVRNFILPFLMDWKGINFIVKCSVLCLEGDGQKGERGGALCNALKINIYSAFKKAGPAFCIKA